jgi:hypothetical protein
VRSSDRISTLGALLVALVAAVGVGLTRPSLAVQFHHVRLTSDVYPLPSPEQTVAASLGWRSALADVLYAHVLVSSGLHLQEKRRFEFVGNYLDTINALDPKFRSPYRFADTLLTIGAVAPHHSDYVKAREILERGMAERPYDGELWNSAGQFMAYLAPSQLKDPKEKKEWRLAGARRLARACELIGSNENIPFHCITAAGLFSRAGERDATRQFLEKVLAVVDTPEVRQLALAYLRKVVGEQERDQVQLRMDRFTGVWAGDLPFVSKDMYLVVGPPFDVAACAGASVRRDFDCAVTWGEWGEQLDLR